MNLDILIPTYNRSKFLSVNFNHLARQIRSLGFQERISIIVSDNGSPDATRQSCEAACQMFSDIRIKYRRSERNLGLEENILQVLAASEAEYVMYLGDDDYLDEGYLKRVMEILSSDANVGYIVGSYMAITADGNCTLGRNLPEHEVAFPAGVDGVVKLARYAHQMSGLVFRRSGILDDYRGKPVYRNLYPFISFACYTSLRGTSYLLAKYKTLVWSSNNKDWRYDDSGLLVDIFKNYKSHMSGIAQARAQISVIQDQIWRLRFSLRRPINYLKAAKAIWSAKVAHPLTMLYIVVLPLKLGVSRVLGRDPIYIKSHRPELVARLGLDTAA